MGVNSAHEVSKHQRNKARSKSEKSQKLKQAKRGFFQKDLPAKLKNSAQHNSVALGLADRGIVHKDLPSILVVCPKSPISNFIHQMRMKIFRRTAMRQKLHLVFLLLILQHSLNGYFPFMELSRHLVQITGPESVKKDADTGSNHSGGVNILTSNLYPITPLTLHTSLQAVAGQAHARTSVTACSVYLPPHDVISQQDLYTLLDQLPTSFILLDDFNVHSISWGSDVTNSHGRQIERLISNNGLCLLNKDEKTYFHKPTRTFLQSRFGHLYSYTSTVAEFHR
ncbi:hypothetical protein AVEN_240640-1 [Araneus ventricosus]|uniref:Endonuclease/exonuclease/phosphatase domain-containing protein n=1 Tax=Araneus ventricosus TaxID=182803 RepID=A0A4Y2D5W7_ARAVE|nr:hypothetical protein AVEN_240640-1 [Araneus ventricosus]